MTKELCNKLIITNAMTKKLYIKLIVTNTMTKELYIKSIITDAMAKELHIKMIITPCNNSSHTYTLVFLNKSTYFDILKFCLQTISTRHATNAGADNSNPFHSWAHRTFTKMQRCK